MYRPPHFLTIRLVLVSQCLLLTTVIASDWPQFRGPNRDGRWDEKRILESFPKNGLNIRWRRPVGGGWASPVVARGRVFVLDVELVEPSARERLHCYEAKTGKILWEYIYKEDYSEWTYVPERGAGPTATPIVENDRIYILGANGRTHCLNVKTGTVLWEKKLGQDYEVAEMSCRPSPLIEGTLLILFTGARPGASVLALDKETGKEVWKALDDRVSNSSPIVITVGNTRQLIVWSLNAITALDPSNGKIYWRELLTTSGNDCTSTPILQGNRLLLSGLMLELSADPPGAIFRWPDSHAAPKRLLSNTSTPLWQGDYIYSARSSGELVCLEASTGKQLWSTNTITVPKNGASIHITPQGDACFLFTDEGNLIRTQLSPSGYREISRSHLIEPTWPFAGNKFVYAPPAFANRHIFVRNEREVVCASLAK